MNSGIPVIQDKIRLRSKRDVLRLFLYTKLIEQEVKFSDSELNVLIELYLLGGYKDLEKEREFFNLCITSKFRTSFQSIRNVLTKFVNLGIIKKPKIHQRYLSTDYLPEIASERVGLLFYVSNAA